MAEDRCDRAYDLIHDRSLYGHLEELTDKIEVAQVATKAKCKGLKQVGSHRISAPDLIKGDMLARLKALGSFVNTCVEQIESL